MLLVPLFVIAVAVLIGIQVGNRIGGSPAAEAAIAAVTALVVLAVGSWLFAAFATRRRRPRRL